jgi:pimeloyl-ACP methyl ester carboxylesterase
VPQKLINGSMAALVPARGSISTALETALAAPERVKGLVLVATTSRPRVTDGWLERLRLVTEGKARRDFGRGDLAQATPPEILRRAFMEEIKTDPRVVYGNTLAVRDFAREDDLARVRCPTLVVVGEEDKECGPAGDVMAARIPNARKVVLPKTGHAQPIVQPEILAEPVLQFLAELPR